MVTLTKQMQQMLSKFYIVLDHGVTVFDKSGTQIAHVPVPEGWTGNICFAGTDRRTLFITASTSIYKLAMRTHGVGSQ